MRRSLKCVAFRRPQAMSRRALASERPRNTHHSLKGWTTRALDCARCCARRSRSFVSRAARSCAVSGTDGEVLRLRCLCSDSRRVFGSIVLTPSFTMDQQQSREHPIRQSALKAGGLVVLATDPANQLFGDLAVERHTGNCRDGSGERNGTGSVLLGIIIAEKVADLPPESS